MKKNGWIALSLLVFELMALVLLAVASVFFAFSSGHIAVAIAMIPLLVIAACTLTYHLMRSFDEKGPEKDMLQKIALVFLVLFLVLFVVAVIYYYLARSTTVEPVSGMETYDVVSTEEETHDTVSPEEATTEPADAAYEAEPEHEKITEEPEVFEDEQVPSVPSMPEMGVPLIVPSAPTFSDVPSIESRLAPAPVSVSNSSYLYEPYVSQYSFDDDFWADFYVQGEDEFILENGTYYFDLYINDQRMGVIQTEVIDENVGIYRDELLQFIQDSLTGDAVKKIEACGQVLFLNALEQFGIEFSYDFSIYEIRLYFPTEMMSLTTLSLRNVTSRPFRPNDGNILLYPVDFSWIVNYALSLGLNNVLSDDLRNSLYVKLSSSNRVRIYDLYLDFDYNVGYSRQSLKFNFGSYVFYYDFKDAETRLRWGNVYTDLLSPTGVNIGIEFDKSHAYASSSSTHKSHVEQYITIEKESEVIVYNGDVEIFRKVLSAGNYRLLDFTLFTGANEIRIVINPLDGSIPTEKIVALNYLYSLLAPGEILYGGAVATGRIISNEKRNHSLNIPYFEERWLVYDPRNITLSGYIKAGLSESMTLNSALAIQNVPSGHSSLRLNAKLANELVIAESFGYSTVNFNFNEYSNEYGELLLPNVYFRIGQQIYTNNSLFSGVNLGLSYYSPDQASDIDYHKISASLSTSLRYGIMSCSFSGSASFMVNDSFRTSWYLSNSLSVILGRNVSVNANITLNASDLDINSVTGRITGAISWGGGSTSASTDGRYLSLDLSAYSKRHRVNLQSYTDNLTSFDSYRFSAAYGYSGELLDFSFNASAKDSFGTLGMDASLSTSTLLAGGKFVMGAYIPSNYLLIGQQGALKGNRLAVGTYGFSSEAELADSFGTYLYNRVDSQGENISIYSYNEDSFGGASVFNVSLMPSDSRKGYVFEVTAENRYSVSGIVMLPDGSLWKDGSSPVYHVAMNDDGTVESELSDYYLFTDADGRYILSDMMPGRYGFDVKWNDEWALVVFDVLEEEDRVFDLQILSNPEMTEFVADDVYAAQILAQVVALEPEVT